MKISKENEMYTWAWCRNQKQIKESNKIFIIKTDLSEIVFYPEFYKLEENFACSMIDEAIEKIEKLLPFNFMVFMEEGGLKSNEG